MKMHLRIDLNYKSHPGDKSKRVFACGLEGELPEGDKYIFLENFKSGKVTCPECKNSSAAHVNPS